MLPLVEVLEAAQASEGISDNRLYKLAISGLEKEIEKASTILDLGCGQGNFGRFLQDKYSGDLDGSDIECYEGFPNDIYRHFHPLNLAEGNSNSIPTRYDIIFAIEVIQTQASPRLFVKMARELLQDNGLLIVTTPNPSTLGSVMTLITKGVYRDFQDGYPRYPAQLAGVLPIDGFRSCKEIDMKDISITYSNRGRIPLTSIPYQIILPFLHGRAIFRSLPLLS